MLEQMKAFACDDDSPALPQRNQASFHWLTRTLQAYGQAQATSSVAHFGYTLAKRYKTNLIWRHPNIVMVVCLMLTNEQNCEKLDIFITNGFYDVYKF